MFDFLTIEAIKNVAGEWLADLGPAIAVPAGLGLMFLIAGYLINLAHQLRAGGGGGGGGGPQYDEHRGVRPGRGGGRKPKKPKTEPQGGGE